MLEESVIARWKERAQKYHADIAADAEEEKQQLEIDRHVQAEREAQASLERLARNQAAELTEKLYEQELHTQCHIPNNVTHHNTKPLLLDAVVRPVTEESPSEVNYDRLLLEARKERDDALLAARQWRDLAETTQAEKQEVKHEMEKSVEVVRDFWRNN